MAGWIIWISQYSGWFKEILITHCDEPDQTSQFRIYYHQPFLLTAQNIVTEISFGWLEGESDWVFIDQMRLFTPSCQGQKSVSVWSITWDTPSYNLSLPLKMNISGTDSGWDWPSDSQQVEGIYSFIKASICLHSDQTPLPVWGWSFEQNPCNLLQCQGETADILSNSPLIISWQYQQISFLGSTGLRSITTNKDCSISKTKCS